LLQDIKLKSLVFQVLHLGLVILLHTWVYF